MKASYLRSYRKQETGNLVFVYKVDGSKEELESYKKAQGEYHTIDKKDGVLWFSPQFSGPEVSLIITSKGKVVADMSQFDMAQSLAEQYKGTELGSEIAKQATAMLLGNMNASKASAPIEAPKVESKPEDLENL